MQFGRFKLGALGSILILSLSAHAQVTVGDTSSVGNSSWFVAGRSLGESFTLPAGTTTLEDFSADLALYTGTPNPVTAQIYSWDGSTLGTELWASSAPVTSTSYQEYSFSDIGLQLDSGSQYIFVLSQPNTSTADFWRGASSDSSYTDGSLYYFSTTAPQTGNAGSAYNTDAIFSATFDNAPGSTNELSVTPVPETRQFILGGLLLCAALAWNFRQDRRTARATLTA